MRTSKKNPAYVILTTAESKEQAESIAYALVEGRVAACANILPNIHSIYRWEGKVESASEWLLLVKTTRNALAGAEAMIRKHHTYACPECIALEVAEGSEPYLNWLHSSVEQG